MALMETIALVWLMLLSLAVGALYVWANGKWHEMRHRLGALDLSERLQIIVSRLDGETIRTNDAMRKAVFDAINCFEDNKILMEKHWSEYHHLKTIAGK